MCEFVFLNHVNICGRIFQLTPKNGTNLANLELTKKSHRLSQFPKLSYLNNELRRYWFWASFGATSSRVAPSHLARLSVESRHVSWRDSCSTNDLR
jgi:hypothetical protein